MQVTLDTDRSEVILCDSGQIQTYPLGSPQGFSIISEAWLRSGWDNKYVYSFTWLGRPIIQFPEDLIRLQEIIFTVGPDVIIETGVAHGGSLMFYATLCKAVGRGRVIGVDIEIRPHNRAAIESHSLFPYITLIEGSSIDPGVVDRVRGEIHAGERVLVALDSDHSKAHVLAELRSYAPLVTPGSFIIAMDGIMQRLVGAPRSQPNWAWDNPMQAALEFVRENRDFVIEEPSFLFNEGQVRERVTYWPKGLLRRVR